MSKRWLVILAVLMLVTGMAYAGIGDTNGGDATATGGSAVSTGGSAVANGGSATGGTGVGTGFANSTSTGISSSSLKSDIKNTNSNIGINANTNIIDSTNKLISDISNKVSNNQDQDQNQGQIQGQVANGIVKTEQGNSQNVNIDGDTQKNYMLVAPAQVATKGMESAAMYSIFGGLNLSQTEEATVCQDKINVITAMMANGLLSKDEAILEAKIAFAQLKDSTKPKRILMFGPKTRGRHLLNAFGILANDSAVNEDKVNKRILEKEKKLIVDQTLEQIIDKGITGNGGNIN